MNSRVVSLVKEWPSQVHANCWPENQGPLRWLTSVEQRQVDNARPD